MVSGERLACTRYHRHQSYLCQGGSEVVQPILKRHIYHCAAVVGASIRIRDCRLAGDTGESGAQDGQGGHRHLQGSVASHSRKYIHTLSLSQGSWSSLRVKGKPVDRSIDSKGLQA